MRKPAMAVGVIAGIVLVTMVWGQVSAPAGTVTIKVGVINSEQVLQQTEEGKRELVRLNGVLEGKRKTQETKTAELQRLQEQFTNQRHTLNPETGAEMQREISRKQLELNRLQEDDRLEVQDLQQGVFNRVAGKLQRIVNDYGQQNGYGLILQRSSSQVFVNPGLEITQEVIKIYDAKHPVAGTSQ